MGYPRKKSKSDGKKKVRSREDRKERKSTRKDTTKTFPRIPVSDGSRYTSASIETPIPPTARIPQQTEPTERARKRPQVRKAPVVRAAVRTTKRIVEKIVDVEQEETLVGEDAGTAKVKEDTENIFFEFLQRGIKDIVNLVSTKWYWRDSTKVAGIRTLFSLFNYNKQFKELDDATGKEVCRHVKALKPSDIQGDAAGWALNNILYDLEVIFFKVFERGQEIRRADYTIHVTLDRGNKICFNHHRPRRIPVDYRLGFPCKVELEPPQKNGCKQELIVLGDCKRERRFSEYVVTYSGGDFKVAVSINWLGPGLRH